MSDEVKSAGHKTPTEGQPDGFVSENMGEETNTYALQAAEEKEAASAVKHYPYGLVEIQIPDSVLGQFEIDREDLMAPGMEDEPHVTVRYGLEDSDIEGLLEMAEDVYPFTVTLGKSKVFPPSKSSGGAAPVVIEVKSPVLHKLNAMCEQVANFKPSDFPDYIPHMTIAYVKPEAAQKYAGKDILEGMSFHITHLTISDPDKHCTEIPLGVGAMVLAQHRDGQPGISHVASAIGGSWVYRNHKGKVAGVLEYDRTGVTHFAVDKKFSHTPIRAALFDAHRFAAKLPTISFKKLWHVGEMDISKKRPDSHEGDGLSVSTHPEEWSQISWNTSGPTWELTKPGNKFLDFHSLTSQQKKDLAKWGVSQGLAEETTVYRVTWMDGDLDEEVYIDYESREKAENEHPEYADSIEEIPGRPVGTKKLEQRMQALAPPIMTMDYLAVCYAEDVLHLDGVWWEDTLDVLAYSAPRGTIFNRMLPTWHRRQVKSAKVAAGVNRAMMLYHGTTEYSWAEDVQGDSVLYLASDRSDAEQYAYEKSEGDEWEGRELKPCLMSIRLADLMKAVEGTDLEMGSDDGGIGHEDMDWRQSLNTFGSFTVGGDLRNLKKLFKMEKLPVHS